MAWEGKGGAVRGISREVPVVIKRGLMYVRVFMCARTSARARARVCVYVCGVGCADARACLQVPGLCRCTPG